MQECGACGLLFGGTGGCPSCGSRVSHAVVINPDEDSGSKPSGPLPGESALADAKEGVQGLDISIASQGSNATSSSSLPFQIGGVGKVESNLPFGVGAPAITSSDVEDDGDDGRSEVGIPENIVVEEPAVTEESYDDPWGMPQAEEATLLSATPKIDAESEPPLVVLKARAIIEEEQLSDSPIFVENAYEITADSFDSEHVYAVEEDVVVHDFGDELQVSEIVVNFDELVDPAEQTVRFDPESLVEGEPELMLAKALPIDTGWDDAAANDSKAAFQALGESRWQDASDGFRLICNALPGDPSSLNNFGISLLQLAIQVHKENPTLTPAEEPHFEAAVLALRQAAQQDKRNPTILYNLATCLATCHRHGVANRIWDAAIALSPDDVGPLNGKAVSQIALSEFDNAAMLLAKAQQMNPDDPIITRNLRRIRPTV
jgi:tetratricopeptide (TPR) repeat protein